MYNVETGVETSINELYGALAEISGNNLPPERGTAKPGEKLRSSVDLSLAGRVMGWRPEVGLTEGPLQTFWFFRGW